MKTIISIILSSLFITTIAFADRIVLSDEAKTLTYDSLVIDGHNDLPWALRSAGDSSLTKYDLTRIVTRFDTDIPRLRKGGMGAQFWSVYVPASTMRSGNAYEMTLEQIDLVHRLAAKYPDDLEMAYSVEDIRRIRAEGKIASLIGVEGGHSIENSMDKLVDLYNKGARYMTITHSKSLSWADSATDFSRVSGLNNFGRQVIEKMNELGFLVDISHVSVNAMKDILEVATAPVIASHSSARYLNSHARNIPNDVLRLVRENGGVIMVNFYNAYIQYGSTDEEINQLFGYGCNHDAENFPRQTDYIHNQGELAFDQELEARVDVDTVVDHIEHIIEVAGIDHVGLGSDYDGVPSLPSQLEDVSGFPYITQALLNRGYSELSIKKILGENVMRAFKQAEEESKNIQNNL
jgi:membrane dipeptidase